MSTAAPTQSTPAAPTGAGGYQVARPGGKCFVTGNPIQPDEKFVAALRETPLGFERVDVSLEAWPQFDRKDIVADWHTVMPRHEQKKKIFVDDETLSGIFERLADATEPAKLNFRFVLGLILMRKRILQYETTRQDSDREIWVVRFRGRDDRLDLFNPKLDEEQVKCVSQQLGEILNEEV